MQGQILMNGEDKLRFLGYEVHVRPLNAKEEQNLVIDINSLSMLIGADVIKQTEKHIKTWEHALSSAYLKIFDSIQHQYEVTKVVQV